MTIAEGEPGTERMERREGTDLRTAQNFHDTLHEDFDALWHLMASEQVIISEQLGNGMRSARCHSAHWKQRYV